MKQNAKEAIVKAAISLFNSNGYSGTSVRDIANLAKVNTATIAYYFNNKAGLLEYCFMYFLNSISIRLKKGISPLIVVQKNV